MEALERWHAARDRGVIEAATGTGKTAVALGAIADLHQQHGDRLRVAIVVPSKVLASQWRTELVQKLGLRSDQIGEQHSDVERRWDQQPVLLTVIDTARTALSQVLTGWTRGGRHSLLVVDECHRSGSEYNAQIFDGRYDASLGLSATPERPDGAHDRVYGGLGRPIYRYPLRRALDDGILAPVLSVNLYVDFDTTEQARWTSLTDSIGVAFRSFAAQNGLSGPTDVLAEAVRLAADDDAAASHLLKLITQRRVLLTSARARLACQRSLLEWTSEERRRALVFHESIAAAEISHEILVDLRVAAGIDHSKLAKADRARAMSRFRSGQSQVLVAVRALDEGVDVPEVDTAIISAGTRSRRQRIQRLGRILRAKPGKQALVFTILVRGTHEEAAVGGRDAALLGADRVRHHRWPAVGTTSAAGTDSTYVPTPPPPTLVDSLTTEFDHEASRRRS